MGKNNKPKRSYSYQEYKGVQQSFCAWEPLRDHLHLELWLRGYSGKETSNIRVSQTVNRLCGHEDTDKGFLKTCRGTIKRKRTVETKTISSKRQMIEDTVDTQFQKQSSLE